MDFSIGCSLSYRVKIRTPFVFNIEAVRHAGQRVRSETLTLSPDLDPERWTMPESGNRYLRAMVEPGPFKLEYKAEVTLDPVLEAPEAVTEVAAGDLPLSVLVHLWPSRYCQADKLQRLAQRTFGHEPQGYRRVNAVCNWIHDNVDYVGFVRIVIGRDAAEVAFASPFGAIEYDKPKVWIKAAQETTSEPTTQAVRAEL